LNKYERYAWIWSAFVFVIVVSYPFLLWRAVDILALCIIEITTVVMWYVGVILFYSLYLKEENRQV